MSKFAIQLTFELDNEFRTLLMTTVTDTTVSGNSTITRHPIVNGDQIADHIYKEPYSLTFSGAISEISREDVLLDGIKLTINDFENLFKRIKDEGIRLSIAKIKLGDSENFLSSFNIYNDMVLTSIQFVEKINSLTFDFSFSQIIVAKFFTDDKATDDNLLPNIGSLKTFSFTDTLVNWNKIIEYLDEVFTIEEDYIKRQLRGFTIFSFFVGWLVSRFFDNTDKNKKISKTISQYKQLRQQEGVTIKDMRNALPWFNNICNQIEMLNNRVSVYGITSDEEQECLLNIADSFFSFVFTKNNLDGTYGLVVKKIDGETEETVNTLYASNINGCPKDISECTSQNSILKFIENQSKTVLATNIFTDNSSSNKIAINENITYVYLIQLLEEDKDINDLTTYYIVLSSMNLENYMMVLQDTIRKVLGF